MTRMNKRQRDYFYPILVKRYGEICRMCGKLAFETNEKFLLIDHKDNDNGNNILDNLQLLCRSCNKIKNPQEDKEFYTREKSPEMKANLRMEPYFRNWLQGLIQLNHKWLLEDIIDAGAEKCECSTETIKRYLRKCLSSEGIYEIVEGQKGREYIQFKPEFR